MKTRVLFVLLMLAVLAGTWPVARLFAEPAQEPEQEDEVTTRPPLAVPEGYRYNPAGRRDPLVDPRSPVVVEVDTGPVIPDVRPQGLPGVLLNEVTGESFWARGYFVSTVGLEEEVVQEYIRRQEKDEERLEQLNMAWGQQPPSGGCCHAHLRGSHK